MIDRFINFFESLTFKKKMIFLIVTALILMMLTMIMANFSNGNNNLVSMIDYLKNNNIKYDTILQKLNIEVLTLAVC